MMKLAHEKDLDGLSIPDEIEAIIKSHLHVLDKHYGKDRDVDDSDGGYVILILESNNYIDALERNGLYINEITPEYSEIIKLADGRRFSNTFCLSNNEFSITFIMPLEITPTHFLEVSI